MKRISEFDNNIFDVDVIVDFSASSTSIELVEICCKNQINLVICPINFSNEQLEYIEKKVRLSGIGVVYAPTLTRGINILMDFISKLAKYQEYHFETIERHSKNKWVPTKTA